MGLTVCQITIEGCNEKMFVPFFQIDSDFSENEEYFREDTLSLGFNNEAERCSKELYDKYFSGDYDGYEDTLSMALEDGAHTMIGDTQFILGNTTYTQAYEIILVCTDYYNRSDYYYEVVVAYVDRY